MTVFLIGSIALIVLAVAVLVRPLLRKPSNTNDLSASTEQSELTLNILRDQQAELEQERKLGNLDEAGYATSHAELQRRLLEELDSGAEPATEAAPSSRPRKTAFALIFLIPLLAIFGYALLGNPMAMQPGATEPHPRALLQAGAAAMERRDFQAAVGYWERLLPMVEPGSEIDQILRDSITRIRAKHNLPAKP